MFEKSKEKPKSSKVHNISINKIFIGRAVFSLVLIRKASRSTGKVVCLTAKSSVLLEQGKVELSGLSSLSVP